MTRGDLGSMLSELVDAIAFSKRSRKERVDRNSPEVKKLKKII